MIRTTHKLDPVNPTAVIRVFLKPFAKSASLNASA